MFLRFLLLFLDGLFLGAGHLSVDGLDFARFVIVLVFHCSVERNLVHFILMLCKPLKVLGFTLKLLRMVRVPVKPLIDIFIVVLIFLVFLILIDDILFLG